MCDRVHHNISQQILKVSEMQKNHFQQMLWNLSEMSCWQINNLAGAKTKPPAERKWMIRQTLPPPFFFFISPAGLKSSHSEFRLSSNEFMLTDRVGFNV